MVVVVQMRAGRCRRWSASVVGVEDDEHTSFLRFLKWERGSEEPTGEIIIKYMAAEAGSKVWLFA